MVVTGRPALGLTARQPAPASPAHAPASLAHG